MSQLTSDEQNDAPSRFHAALARWSADPVLATVAVPASRILLVLDADAARFLGSSNAAATVRTALENALGRVNASLRLGEQIRRLGPLSDRPRLVRLRLDGRGIAAPTTCLIARAAWEDGTTVLLIAPVGKGAGSREAEEPTRASAPALPSASAVPAPAERVVSARLVWRSDADGVITYVSGVGAEIAGALEGRSWTDLCPGDANARLLAEIEARRTFRAVPAVIRLPGSGDEIESALSGVPSVRPNSPFAGYAGFGTVASQRPMRERQADAVDGSSQTAGDADVMPDVEAVAPSGDDEASPSEAGTPSQPDLSTTEHAAFREIAHALGARFAGDDEEALPETAAAPMALIPVGEPAVAAPAPPEPAPAPASTVQAPAEPAVVVDRTMPVDDTSRTLGAVTGEPPADSGQVELASAALRDRVARLLSGEPPAPRPTAQDRPSVIRSEPIPADRQRRAEIALRQKLEFFAKAARGIRSPIVDILAATDAMLVEHGGASGDEPSFDRLNDIRASGDRALARLDDLVQLARIESGRVELAFAELPVNALISSCIAQMQPQAARDRIVVRTSLSPDLTTLLADERSLRKATLGAIANALRVTEPGGQVIVSTTLAERGEVALRVRDTGVGMTAEEIANALEPYRQRLPRARTIEPSGLGLILTKALVEANRGVLRLTSKKDEGTLVEMVFPPQALRA